MGEVDNSILIVNNPIRIVIRELENVTAEPVTTASEHAPTERVRDEVRAMLRSGALVPGERLKEFDLAQRLQVNRSVAREALRTLEYAGLVRIVPNRGAELRKLSMEEALNLYDLRAGLARAAARSAALRAERAEVKQLQELQNAAAAVLDTGDARRYNQINMSFHSLIFTAARNPRLRTMNAAVDDELSLFLTNTHYTPNAFERSWQEHQQVVDAIRNRDSEAAAGAFESHVLKGKQRLVDGQVTIRF